ncbi:ScbR family autoregulator-binding transcription factor [Streptomyces sp. NPDC058739]|uniref:ScbR family autoregulator-binding transcription factor n=1 Tax=Streptomyces sp. NPDC058739 TaxID=3346618 RepID=UPI003685AB42
MPRQERAERTRELVVRAAAVCFDTTGFAATSLSEIVEMAEVSKGALYFHFSSKEKLAEAVIAQLGTDWREILRAARTPDGPPLQSLIDMTHALARRMHQDVVFRAGLRLCDDRRRPGETAPVSPYLTWRRTVGLALARSRRRGELLPGLDLAQAAQMLTATTAGIELLSRQDSGWLRPRVVAGAWGALLPALVPVDRLDSFRPAGSIRPLPRPRSSVDTGRGEAGPGEAGSADLAGVRGDPVRERLHERVGH